MYNIYIDIIFVRTWTATNSLVDLNVEAHGADGRVHKARSRQGRGQGVSVCLSLSLSLSLCVSMCVCVCVWVCVCVGKNYIPGPCQGFR
jgi:hypothetical protein